MSIEITFERSTEQAEIIKEVELVLRRLDILYLEAAVEEMERNHSIRTSGMVLASNVHTIQQTLDLEAAKIKHLKDIIVAATSLYAINPKRAALEDAVRGSEKLSSLLNM